MAQACLPGKEKQPELGLNLAPLKELDSVLPSLRQENQASVRPGGKKRNDGGLRGWDVAMAFLSDQLYFQENGVQAAENVC